MIIAICGFGTSGSSAVIDFLRGYDDMQRVPFEFQLVHQADGLLDLKYHLTESRERVACNAAIKRFRTLMFKSLTGRRMHRLAGQDYDKIVNSFLDKITLAEWKGRSNYDPVDISDRSTNTLICSIEQNLTRLLRCINRSWCIPGYRTRYFSIIEEEQFNSAAKELLEDFFHVVGYDLHNNLLLDMLLSANNPEKGMEFFPDAKVILVTRDPRDIYVRSRTGVFENSFMPQSSVEDFCTFYRANHELAVPSKRTITIQYEDLIYRYEETREQIKAFLGYTRNPESEFKYFNPNISVKYTNTFGNYPKHSDAIKYIEEHLNNYLYTFTEYAPLEVKTKYEGIRLK